jgi:hypothetical protein
MQNGWKCPRCGKDHSKPHYAYRGQLDPTKKPEEEGRVKFNRVGLDGNLKYDTPTKYNLPPTGDAKTRKGDDNGLFCSHCGFEQQVIVLINTNRKK